MQRWWSRGKSNHRHAASLQHNQCDAHQGKWELCGPVSSSIAVEVVHNARTMAVDPGK